MSKLVTKIDSKVVGTLTIGDYTLETPDGNVGDVLTTDGSGSVSFEPQASAGSPLDAYPIGAIYISTVSTDPGTIFGGTWVAFSQGRVLVGLDTSDPDFNSSGELRGSKTIDIQHRHTGPNHRHEEGNHRHFNKIHQGVMSGVISMNNHDHDRNVTGGYTGFAAGIYKTADHVHDHSFNHEWWSEYKSSSSWTEYAGADYTGNGLSTVQTIVQPSIVVYMFKRTS